MSIYGTEAHLSFVDENDETIEVHVQVVPSWVTWESPGMPPPRLGVSEGDGYRHPRFAVFTGPWTTKGTERNGQEYVNPICILGGEEFERLTFRDALQLIVDGVALARSSGLWPRRGGFVDAAKYDFGKSPAEATEKERADRLAQIEGALNRRVIEVNQTPSADGQQQLSTADAARQLGGWRAFFWRLRLWFRGTR